jgi:hypothetical protein
MLAQLFERASLETQVEHPLCAKCLDNVARELEERVAAVEAQARAYEDALATLQVRKPILHRSSHLKSSESVSES